MKRYGVLGALGLCLFACSGSDTGPGAVGGDDAATDADGSTDDAAIAETSADDAGDAGDAVATLDGAADDASDAATGDDDAPFATQRAACAFKAGALPKETFGPSIAGLDVPIDTIVIVSQENHSFDNYYTGLPAFGQPDADVTPAGTKLKDSTGKAVAPAHLANYCTYDPKHDWTTMHNDYDGGKNDKFLSDNGDNTDTIGYYTSADLPFYYGLANDYGIGDRYFSGLLGPTGPNRLYLYAASSYGHVVNGPGVDAGAPDIFKRLTAAKVTFGIYSAGATMTTGCQGPYSFERAMFCGSTPVAKTIADFQADAAAGKLPSVSWIYSGSDEHPSADVQKGQSAVYTVFDALAKSPQWYDPVKKRGALFVLTYDEGGGFYDHVPPPSACKPDDIPPNPSETSSAAQFDRYGFRVPILMASPFSKAHYVSHVVASHTSLLRFLELRFDLPAMTARDANAGALLDFFDFSGASFATPKIPAKPAVATGHGC